MFDNVKAATGQIGEAREQLARAELQHPGYERIARESLLNAHYTDPGIVDAAWRAIRRLGVTNDAIAFEPGCGSGVWMRSPHAVDAIEGVEMDPISARVTHWLTQPGVTVRTARLEHWSLRDSQLAAGRGFDVAVGNVPFAQFVPTAPDNPHGLSLHNYAILKAVRSTREGGVVAVITSRYTMDSADSSFRQLLANHARLVAAVRLPTSAHREMAGTEVVTDLLILQPVAGGDPDREKWMPTGDVHVGDELTPIPVNEWFVHHPEHVLGTYDTGGMYRRDDLRVINPHVADRQWLADLETTLTTTVGRARAAGVLYQPQGAAQAVADAAPVLRGGQRVDVSGVRLTPDAITLDDPGGFVRINASGEREPYTPRPKSDAAELRRLVELRNLTVGLLDSDAAEDVDRSAALRAQLNTAYDTYSRLHGPLNRYTRLAPRAGDEPDDEPRVRRPSMGGFRSDPTWRMVMALEDFDDDTQTATKAAIFHGSVARRVATPERVDDPADAIAIALGLDGRLDDERLARLLGLDNDVDVVEARLGDLAYRDPATGRLEPAALYLSGLVREKLAAAESAAALDPRWERNVDALRAVQPRDLGADEVIARPGVTWLPLDDLRAFCREVLDVSVDVEHVPELATFSLKATGFSVTNDATWGVPGRRTGVHLIEDMANQRPTRCWVENSDGSRSLDVEATSACTDKRAELETAFNDWVWSDPDRAQRLLQEYNARFNNWVEPRWDGSHLALPGLSAHFTPRKHQLDATWRAIATRDRGTLLAHAVGAGKTAEMVMTAMELRRLGLSHGPVVVVVPNSMLEQFSREWLQLYPSAKLLAADKDAFAGDARRAFVARAATGDWDAVVLTHSAFTRIPMSAAYQASYIEAEVAELRTVLERARANKSGRSVKAIERTLKSREEKLEKQVAKADQDVRSVTWEQLGAGALFVDEAHIAKNLGFPTKIEGAAGGESARALDLLMKADWMREHRDAGSVLFATATPVSNRVGEMWVMQRFLDPAGLERANCRQFDAWAANFGKSVTTLELAPSGRGFRTTTRFSQFTNVPELAAMFRSFADVRSDAELNLPRPAIKGGAPTVIAVAADDELVTFVDTLLDRAEQCRGRKVEKGDDNMLAVATDGRLAALDIRLVDESRRASVLVDDGYQSPKVRRAVEEIAQRYHANLDRQYLSRSGELSPVTGAAQIVFCDQGTPGNKRLDVYDELRRGLANRGVPPSKVAFIQDAKDDAAKQRLFAGVRDGRIAVLVGSTESMGVGVNVQTRLIAEHALTVPWRPDQVKQSDGRILRQGNQNDEVEILRYVTEKSFDAYSWQTVERKERFVSQIMADPSTLAREMSDEDDGAVSFAVVKAAATGDERIMQVAKLEMTVQRLERSATQDAKSRRILGYQQADATASAARHEEYAGLIAGVLRARTPGAGIVLDNPRIELEDGKPITHSQLGAHLALEAFDVSRDARMTARQVVGDRPVAAIDGLRIMARGNPDVVTFTVEGLPGNVAQRVLEISELRDKQHTGIGVSITNMVERLERRRAECVGVAADGRERAAALQGRLDQPWPHQAELARARNQLSALQAELMETPPAVDVPAPSIAPPTPQPFRAHSLGR